MACFRHLPPPAEAAELQDLAHSDKVSIHRLDVTRVEDIYDIDWEMRDTP